MLTPDNLVAHIPDAPVALLDLADPRPGTVEYAAAVTRGVATQDISALPWLPQLPDESMQELYDRIEAAERQYAAPNLLNAEYGPGTATEPNEIGEVHGAGEFLFTAVHATRALRRDTGKLGFPDTGTAGLTAVLAENFGHGYILRGQQTGSAAIDETHPIKNTILPHMATASGFMDVHGAASNLFVGSTDAFNVSAHLGLGENPDEELLDFAHDVARWARTELGLYAIVGNEQQYYSQKKNEPGEPVLRREDDGTAYRGSLAGSKPHMMNNFVRRQFAVHGNPALSLQVELAGLNRLTPLDTSSKSERTRVVGVALGYQLLKHIVERSVTDSLASA